MRGRGDSSAEQLRQARPAPKSTAAGPGLFVYALAIAFIVACMLAVVGVRQFSVKTGYRSTKADRAFGQVRKENDELKVEAEMLRSPHRVEGIAKLELGLASPAPEQIVVLKTRKTAWKERETFQARLR
jgi:cell division protein FtsL